MSEIKLINAKKLRAEDICSAEADVPGAENSKPSLISLGGDELAMFTVHAHAEEPAHGGRCNIFHTVMFRSHDGGRSWDVGSHMPFEGYEPSASVIDGVVFVQTHLHPNIFSDNKKTVGNIYRSGDGCKTWSSARIGCETFGLPADIAGFSLSRNSIKLPDGSIIVCANASDGQSFRLRSSDAGMSWQTDRISDDVERVRTLSLMCESVMFVTPSGRLMAASRVDPALIRDKRIPNLYTTDKSFDTDEGCTMLLIESDDWGLSWRAVRGLGYGAMMYPSVVYLNERDFVFTYTQRNSRIKTPYQHMGVQAVLGRENPDGSFDIDFDSDIMVLDDKTPDCGVTGEGFGMTRLLPDGSLVTPYSYGEYAQEFTRLLSDGDFLSDDLFRDWCVRSGNADPVSGPDSAWWHGCSDEWKRVIIGEYGLVMRQWRHAARVMRWSVRLR